MIYLYVKTHNVTGLKYLGKTIQNPFTYKGSGKRWINHVKKHGYDVSTEIVGEFETHKELIEVSIALSEKLDIVSNPNWTNLRIEAGDGGDTSMFMDYSKLNRGKGLTYEQRYGKEKAKQMRESRSHNFTDDHKRKISEASFGKTYEQLECPHCHNIYPSNRFNVHINLCKDKTNKICPTCNNIHRKKTEYCSKKCYYQRSNSMLLRRPENDEL